MDSKNLIIFSDFDGTFTAKDVGNRIFTIFSGGQNRRLVDDWKKGLISSRECLAREAELIRITPEEFNSFIGDFELVSGGKELYNLSLENEIPFILVSDGLDLYIEYILKKYHLENIPFIANHGVFRNGGIKIEFPYNNDGCSRCGSCKGERIKEVVAKIMSSRKEPEVIFIGDGLSDICALPQSDIIFARGDLFDYCRTHNFDAIEYHNFFDILKWLKGSGRITG